MTRYFTCESIVSPRSVTTCLSASSFEIDRTDTNSGKYSGSYSVGMGGIGLAKIKLEAPVPNEVTSNAVCASFGSHRPLKSTRSLIAANVSLSTPVPSDGSSIVVGPFVVS